MPELAPPFSSLDPRFVKARSCQHSGRGGMGIWKPGESCLLEDHSHRQATRCVCALAYSPDGKSFAAGSLHGELFIWDVLKNSIVIGPLTKQTKGIRSLSYSSDGKHLVSSAGDKTIMTWDVSLARSRCCTMESWMCWRCAGLWRKPTPGSAASP